MRYRITSNGFPTVTVSKIARGEKIYAEMGTMLASSPIGEGLLRRRVMATELNGESYVPPQMPTWISQWWAGVKSNVRQTVDSEAVQEGPYMLFEAVKNDQKVSFKSCFPGTIMAWNARPLVRGENYVLPNSEAKSIFAENEADRPHGTLIAINGAFLAGDIRVQNKAYHTGDSSIRDNSKTGDTFQRLEGNGLVFLEVHGDLGEIPLYPGESVDICPGYLLGFTEGIRLKMIDAGDRAVKAEDNQDSLIRCTAGAKGGYVYTHSVDSEEFFNQRSSRH